VPRSTTQDPINSALGFRREMQTAIGQQLRAESELPQELSPELAAPLIRPKDRENDPYADILGTC
jgi:hypothetical protein